MNNLCKINPTVGFPTWGWYSRYCLAYSRVFTYSIQYHQNNKLTCQTPGHCIPKPSKAGSLKKHTVTIWFIWIRNDLENEVRKTVDGQKISLLGLYWPFPPGTSNSLKCCRFFPIQGLLLYKQDIEEHAQSNPGRISKTDFLKVISGPFHHAFTHENITKSFEKTGTWPIDCLHITQEMTAASEGLLGKGMPIVSLNSPAKKTVQLFDELLALCSQSQASASSAPNPKPQHPHLHVPTLHLSMKVYQMIQHPTLIFINKHTFWWSWRHPSCISLWWISPILCKCHPSHWFPHPCTPKIVLSTQNKHTAGWNDKISIGSSGFGVATGYWALSRQIRSLYNIFSQKPWWQTLSPRPCQGHSTSLPQRWWAFQQGTEELIWCLWQGGVLELAIQNWPRHNSHPWLLIHHGHSHYINEQSDQQRMYYQQNRMPLIIVHWLLLFVVKSNDGWKSHFLFKFPFPSVSFSLTTKVYKAAWFSITSAQWFKYELLLSVSIYCSWPVTWPPFALWPITSGDLHCYYWGMNIINFHHFMLTLCSL